MKQIFKGVILTAALAAVSVLLVMGFLLKDGTKTEDYIDQSLFYLDTPEERICTDSESGLSYAQGEILVSFDRAMDMREAKAAAKRHGAKLVGLIGSTGDCQWLFSGEYTLADLKKMASELKCEEGITGAWANYVTEIGINGLADASPQEGGNWSDAVAGSGEENWSDTVTGSGEGNWFDVLTGLAEKDGKKLDRESLEQLKNSLNALSERYSEELKTYLNETPDKIKENWEAYVREFQNRSSMNKEAEELIHADEARESFWWQTRDGKLVPPIDVGIIDTFFDTDQGDVGFAETFFNPDSEWLKERAEDVSIFEKDQIQHGTHVAGILGAACNNGRGLDGMYPLAWEGAKFRSHLYGVSMRKGDRMSDKRRTNIFHSGVALELLFRNGVRLVNYSVGYTGETLKKLKRGEKSLGEEEEYFGNYLQKSLENGREFLLVCAAGNESQTIDSSLNNEFNCISMERYPSVYQRILVVGACGNDGKLADFSNGGNRVDLVAPGEDIWSTVPVSEPGTRKGYKKMGGTSQATPYVTGTAAMVWTLQPELRGDEVKALLISSSTRKVDGYALLDAEAAVDACILARRQTNQEAEGSGKNENTKNSKQLFDSVRYDDEDIRRLLEKYYRETLVPQFGRVSQAPVRAILHSGEAVSGAEGAERSLQELGQQMAQTGEEIMAFRKKLRAAAEGITGYRIDDFDEDGSPELLLMRTEVEEREGTEYLQSFLEMFEYSFSAKKVILQDYMELGRSICLEQYPQNQVALFQQNVKGSPLIVWGIDSIGADSEHEDTYRVSVLRYKDEMFLYRAASGYGFWEDDDLRSMEAKAERSQEIDEIRYGKSEEALGPAFVPVRPDLFNDEWGHNGKTLVPLEELAEAGLASDKLRSDGARAGFCQKLRQTAEGEETVCYFDRSFSDSFAEIPGEGNERYPIGELMVNRPTLPGPVEKAYDIQGYGAAAKQQEDDAQKNHWLDETDVENQAEKQTEAQTDFVPDTSDMQYEVQIGKLEESHASAEYPIFSATGGMNGKGVEAVNQLFYEEALRMVTEQEPEMRRMDEEIKASGGAGQAFFEITVSSVWMEGNRCSVVQYYRSYTGGTHGYGYRVAHSYDLITGKELSMGELLGCGEEKAKEAVVAAYRKEIIGQVENITEEKIRENFDQMTYWMTEEGMWVSIPTNVIASYAAGPQEALVTPELAER